MRPRNASPTSIFLPETRNGMSASAYVCSRESDLGMGVRGVNEVVRDGLDASDDWRGLFLPPSLHRGRNAHCFAIFRHRPPRDVDAGLAELVDNGVVGEHVAWAFGVDQLLDPMAHRLGGMRFPAMGGGDRRSEEIF